MRSLPKKIIFAFLLLSSAKIFAQRFVPGIIAGADATDIVGLDPRDTDFHKGGFVVGGLLSTKLSEKNSLHFEITYIQKGSTQPADSSNNYVFTRLRFDYVEIPVILKHKIKFNINKKPIDKFYFELGPSYGRLVRMNINDNGNIFTEGNFRKNEFSIHVGVGFSITNNLSFNIRYSNSILPVFIHPEQLNSFFWYTFNKGDNVGFLFTLRYMFGSEAKEETN
jgi:outer membrane protein with beta-barrel domain